MVALPTLTELRTTSVVPVSMVLPTEVALATKGLALALVSPTLPQVTPRVSRVVVTLGPGLSLGYHVNGAVRQGDGGLLPESRIPEPGFPLVPCVGCGMRACEVCSPMPARLCESCRITSCTPTGALISTVVDKDRFHHKCNTIVLPAEPTADKLREWLSEIKERVRNAFSFDSDYAVAWISETERLDYDALGGPCKYPILDSNFTSAIRECIKTRAVRDKMNRLTDAAQNMNPCQGIKGRQILKLLLNHLQTGVEDDQTFKIAELTSLKCRQTGHSDDEARLRSYLSAWDNLISGIRKKIDDGVLLAVFIENVRHLRCSRGGIAMWPLGLSRGFIRLVRTVSNGGRSARTRFRCTRLFMSRGHDQALTPVRGIGILVLLVLCGGTIHLPGRVIRAPRSPLGPGGMASRDHLRPERAARETERLQADSVSQVAEKAVACWAC